MENYQIAKRLIKIKESLDFSYLEKYYQNTIKTKQTILDIKKLENEKEEYKKINLSIISSKEIIFKEKQKYQIQEVKKNDELINLIMLKKNQLLNSEEEIKKLKDFLVKTNFQKFYDQYGHESEINWIKKPIDSLKEDWEIEKIKDYFIYVGSQNFRKKENFYWYIY